MADIEDSVEQSTSIARSARKPGPRREVMNSSRDTDRIDRLLAANQRLSHDDDGTVLRSLLLQTSGLWQDVISSTWLYLARPGINPLDVENTSFLSRLDQTVIDDVIRDFGCVDLTDERVQRQLVNLSLSALQSQLIEASRSKRHQGTEPEIFTDSGVAEDARPYVTMWQARIRMLQEAGRAHVILDELEFRSRAETERVAQTKVELDEAAAALEGLRLELTEARAERAQNQLSDHFKTLSSRERWASWVFRALTFVLLLGGAAYAGYKVPTSSDWPETVSHIAIIAAIGAAAAYTSRLGTLHRSTADWAKAIQVQLKTFQDFLATVTDDNVKNRVYEEFGRRVLGSPPVLGKVADESVGLPSAQIVELASLIASTRRGG